VIGISAVPGFAREAGFSRAGFVDPVFLANRKEELEALLAKGWFEKEEFDGMELDWVLHPSEWAESRSILVCALSCFHPEPDDLSSPGEPHALIARFARRNYYAASVRLLRGVLLDAEEKLGIPARGARIFSNSRIPEKPMIAAAGLGSVGSNGLAIIPGLGSIFVIAGAVLPVSSSEIEPGAGAPLKDPCAACDLCLKACPVGAIASPGLVDPGRCLQGIAARRGLFPQDLREAWGSRLYGCEECQKVCPHNLAVAEAPDVPEGIIGPSVSLKDILAFDASGVKTRLKSTPMGASRISGETLLRNALIAAGNRGEGSLAPYIARHLESGSAEVRDAARWALRQGETLSRR
jgi:epoxyqueuosine reductase